MIQDAGCIAIFCGRFHFQIISVSATKQTLKTTSKAINDVHDENKYGFFTWMIVFAFAPYPTKQKLAQLFPQCSPIGKYKVFDRNRAVANNKCPTGIEIVRKIS